MSMTENQVLALKEGDVFIFPDWYTSTSGIGNWPQRKQHNYHCHVMSVIIDDDCTQGFTIKRYLKTKNRWVYEFFDVWKVSDYCKSI